MGAARFLRAYPGRISGVGRGAIVSYTLETLERFLII